MSDMLEGLNSAQEQAVKHLNGPLLIVAGAGTGKTTVLTRRYVHLLQTEELTTERILALTFTEKAAGEMEDRVLNLLPNGSYDFWISTFHGFCQRLLEQYALEIGLPTHFRVINETDAWLLLRRHIDRLPLDYYRPLGNPVKFLAELLRHFSRAKDEGVTPEAYVAFAENAALDGDAEFVTGERARLHELAGCYAAYRQILREEGALDFGDLILETLRLLKERPRVLKEVQEQFRYLMVDEFQDTNWAQYDLIKLIGGAERNITVVGDDDQAIYKFRGASLANILQFRDDFPEALTITLTENYRSKQEILDAAYGSITKNNPNRLEVQLQGTGLQKKLFAVNGDGGEVRCSWHRTLQDEAEAVMAQIKEYKKEDPDLRWGDIAILSRSNDGAEPFIEALERHGIPFRFFALRGLYSKPEIVNITAMFSLLDGYRESSAVWRVMSSPVYGFPQRDIAIFLGFATKKTGKSLWEALRMSRVIPEITDESVRRAESLVSHVENLTEAARRETPLRMLQLVLDKTGYLATIMKLPEAEKIESIRVLNGLADRLRRYEASTRAPTLRGFMEEFRLEIDSGEEGALNADPNEGPDLVRVLTIHASKGLEFRHVFIVSLVDQRFPTRVRKDAIPLPDGLINERLPDGDAHLEEERRLFYVAMTRAKETVTLTGAESYGGTRQKKPSIFLTELEIDPAALLPQETTSLISLTPPTPLSVEDFLEDQDVFPLKRRFSFTQLAAFQNCPLQYKFAHVYKIPILGSFQKSFGNCIHLTLEEILKTHLERGLQSQGDLFTAPALVSPVASGFRVSLEEALKIYETRWAENDDWYENKGRYDEYHLKGKEAVKQLMAEWTAAPPQVEFLERPFDWSVGDHSLRGKVDRLDRLATGGYAIIDYKTGSAKTEDTVDTKDKEQLWIYQLAMEDMGLSITRLSYVYVLSGESLEVELLQGEKREAFRERIAKRMNEILLSRFPPNPSSFVCRYCDFRAICEYREL